MTMLSTVTNMAAKADEDYEYVRCAKDVRSSSQFRRCRKVRQHKRGL